MNDAPVFRARLLLLASAAVGDARRRQRLEDYIAALEDDLAEMTLRDRNETVGLIGRIRQLFDLADRGGSREAESVMGEFSRMRGWR